MATAMTCSQCWTTAAPGKTHCPRCGAKLTGAPPSVAGLLKSYPWLGVLLALSLLATIWAATRGAPKLEPVPPAAEPPVTAAPPPAPEPASEEPLPPPPMPAPAPEPEAPQPAPPTRPDIPTLEDIMPPPPPR